MWPYFGWATNPHKVLFMRTTQSFCFYCRESKKNKQGYAPVELSIIINQKRVLINLPLKYTPEDFNRKRQPDFIRQAIDEYRVKLNTYMVEMLQNNIPITASNLRDILRSGGVKTYTVESLFNDHIALLSLRTNKEVVDKYIRVRELFYAYYGKDKELSSITPSVIEGFYCYINKGRKESTTGGMMTKLKTVFKFALANGHMKIDPFQNIKITKGKSRHEYLTEEELKRLVETPLPLERLDKVRDIAVLSASTGLAYIDLCNLTMEDISRKDDLWYINKTRHKTGIEYTTVVLPEGRKVIEKYNGIPSIPSNQKLNAYIKEIQVLCNIDKPLHFHLMRKTFATLMLNRGVRMDVVAKLLGHSTPTLTAKLYTHVHNETILNEVGNAVR